MPKVWNKRDKNIPKDAIYVGRPTKWGNPFTMKDNWNDREAVVHQFSELMRMNHDLADEARIELKGKDLVCWCSPLACHADILLEIANDDKPS